jgi:hypothetical protein
MMVIVPDKTPSAYHIQELQVKFLVLLTWLNAEPLVNLLEGYTYPLFFKVSNNTSNQTTLIG